MHCLTCLNGNHATVLPGHDPKEQLAALPSRELHCPASEADTFVIEPKNYRRWLEPGEVHSLPIDLLWPYPEEGMKSWRVSDKVGNTRNNWAELIEPIPEDQPKPRKIPTAQSRRKNCHLDSSSKGRSLVHNYAGFNAVQAARESM